MCARERACMLYSCWYLSSTTSSFEEPHHSLVSNVNMQRKVMDKSSSLLLLNTGDMVRHFKQTCWVDVVIWLPKEKNKVTTRARSDHESHKVSISLIKPFLRQYHQGHFFSESPSLSPSSSPTRLLLLSIPQLGHYLKRPLLEISSERWGLTFKRRCHSWANFSAKLKPDNCDINDFKKLNVRWAFYFAGNVFAFFT